MNRRWIGPGLAIMILLVFMLLPPIEPITPMGMRVAGIFFFTMVLWLTEGIGYPSFLCVALLAITGVMSVKAVFSASWGNPLVAFIVAACGLAEALRISGFSRRFALWFVSRPFAAEHPWAMVAMFWLAVWLMGTVTSGSASAITFMAVGEPLLTELGYRRGERFPATLMMGLAWVASVAFITTPIGHGSNLMFIDWVKRDMGYNLTFPKWLAAGFPIGLLMYIAILVFMRLFVRPDMGRFRELAAKWVREEAGKLGPMRLEEKIAAGMFATVLAIWLVPGFLIGVLPGPASYLSQLGVAVPPLVACCLLSILHVKGKSVMSFREWMAGTPWETFALVSAIFVLADIIGDPKTGIAEFFAAIFKPIVASVPFFVYRFIAGLWVVIQTNLMSNTVSATTVYQAMVPAAIATGVGNPVALGFSIWSLARFAYATPSATTNCALVTGSGWVPIPFMMKYGLIFSLISVVLGLFVIYPWTSFIFR